MHTNKMILLILNCLFITSITNSYNIGYHGNDAYVSYETSWGKERFVKEDYIKYFPYYKEYVEDINLVDISTINISKLPYPYSTLKTILPFYNRGMYFNSQFMTKLFKHNNIVDAIEIGSYYGLSTRHIASLLPEHGTLYAIDTWQEYHENMDEQFLSNVIHSGLTSKILPLKGRSDELVKLVQSYKNNYDLIYIDGDHETAGVLSDLELYFPLAGSRGIVCGDDWLLKTVRAAVLLFAQQKQLTVYSDCNFWFLKNEGEYKVRSLLEAPDEAWIF
ncbi:MAG TPA: class I SAM-dependent methyltransferase [Candidatus Saccharimonadales bacterium]|nr:class I SAM-dependent methyltransferase [Candidatus Saccharimonadales bacterium]